MRTFLSVFIVFAIYICYLPSVSAEDLKSTAIQNPQASTVAEPDNHTSNQLIIKFKESTNTSQKQTIFQKINAEELSSIRNGNFSLVSLPNESNSKKVSDLLLTFPEVEFVEPNYKATTCYTPSDAKYLNQWYTKQINMPSAWNITLGNPNIKVAVIDAGLQVTHPDLKGSIIKPYNAVTGGKSIPASIHGTHVAGIIAASMNKVGITGIAPKVKIIPVNVFEGETADIYTVADGIDYAVKAGADIINLSLTTEDYTEVLDYSIQSAVKKGVLVVAAVGNETTSRPQYPAAYEHVVAVSATSYSDRRATFSNYGSYINLSAPGVNIYSTVPTNSYKNENGTSMATPIVSGVSALILSKNPFLTPTQVTNILQKSSVDLGVKGWDKYFGYGRVDAYRALLQTPTPLSNITKSSNTFTYASTQPLSLSFSAKKGTKISLYIKNSKDQIIRKLVTIKHGQVPPIQQNGMGKWIIKCTHLLEK